MLHNICVAVTLLIYWMFHLVKELIKLKQIVELCIFKAPWWEITRPSGPLHIPIVVRLLEMVYAALHVVRLTATYFRFFFQIIWVSWHPFKPARDHKNFFSSVFFFRHVHDRVELQIKVTRRFVMSNGNLFVGGSIHHGADRFSDVVRERQCAFMSIY